MEHPLCGNTIRNYRLLYYTLWSGIIYKRRRTLEENSNYFLFTLPMYPLPCHVEEKYSILMDQKWWHKCFCRCRQEASSWSTASITVWAPKVLRKCSVMGEKFNYHAHQELESGLLRRPSLHCSLSRAAKPNIQIKGALSVVAEAALLQIAFHIRVIKCLELSRHLNSVLDLFLLKVQNTNTHAHIHTRTTHTHECTQTVLRRVGGQPSLDKISPGPCLDRTKLQSQRLSRSIRTH